MSERTALRAKLSEWTRRYLPLEIVATLTALIGAWAASALTASTALIAFAGTWGENLGYYLYASLREFRIGFAADNMSAPRPSFWKTLRNMLVEFGPAELVDSFVVRPACMYAGQAFIGSLGWGIAAGKLAADVVFYGLVILAYEWRKKYLD